MRVLLIASLIAASSMVVRGPFGAADVESFQQQRFVAMVRQDVAVVSAMLADDLTYTHTSGEMETKAEFLETLRSRRIVYERIEPADVQVRMYGDSAVVTGRSTMHIRSEGQPMTFPIRFIEVDVQRDGRWQMVAWQATRLPAESSEEQ